MHKNFAVLRYRGDPCTARVVLTDPANIPAWCNVVEVVRHVVGKANGSARGYWSDITLIPDDRGSDGYWSVTDLQGRRTSIYDLDFLKVADA